MVRGAWAGGILSVLVAAGLAARTIKPHDAPPAPDPPALPATLHALGDLAPGVPLGPYQVADVRGPVGGAVIVRATSPGGDATFEVRLLADRPRPPARTRRYAIYYRGTDGGPDVLAGAAALASVIDKGPADDPPIAGVTTYPTTMNEL